MVCQSAGQTRFRALKHENGIDGSATIIVKVIACFQPLQDCQAEYFRQMIKPVTQSVFLLRWNYQFSSFLKFFRNLHRRCDIVHLLVTTSIEWRRVLNPGFKTNNLIQICRVLSSAFSTDTTYHIWGIHFHLTRSI